MQVLTLTGNVGRDPETRTTQKGDQVCSFSVASKQGFGRDAKTEWFRCSIWGKRGDTVAQYLRKGMMVTVVGEFTIGDYQGKPQYEIRVSDVAWPPAGEKRQDDRGGGGGGGGGGGFGGGGFGDDLDDNVPFATASFLAGLRAS